MNIINVSLLAESGNTARVAHLLENEPAIGKLLKTIPAPYKTSLFETVGRWIAAGTKLEELEHKSEESLAKEATTPVTKAMSTIWGRIGQARAHRCRGRAAERARSARDGQRRGEVRRRGR